MLALAARTWDGPAGPRGLRMSDHPAEKLVRDFQDRITRGTFDGVYGLGDADRDHVMECQARACTEAFVDLYRIPAELDLDGFLRHMEFGGSSKVRIRREGDAILWEELHGGRCVCPLVTRDVVTLEPTLCRCAVHWLRMLFERHVRGPVAVELLESAARGDENCAFRVTIGDPSHPSRG